MCVVRTEDSDILPDDLGCGPRSLNNLVRNMVAKRISPSKIARGDARGNVELVTEDFFY